MEGKRELLRIYSDVNVKHEKKMTSVTDAQEKEINKGSQT